MGVGGVGCFRRGLRGVFQERRPGFFQYRRMFFLIRPCCWFFPEGLGLRGGFLYNVRGERRSVQQLGAKIGLGRFYLGEAGGFPGRPLLILRDLGHAIAGNGVVGVQAQHHLEAVSLVGSVIDGPG